MRVQGRAEPITAVSGQFSRPDSAGAADLPRFGPKTARSGQNAATRLLGRMSAGESRDGRPGRPHSRIAEAAEVRRRAGAVQDGTTALVGLRGGHGGTNFLDRFADFGPVVLLGRVGEQAQRVEQGA